MRWLLFVILVTAAPAAAHAGQSAESSRNQVIAALEHLLATGEPRHVSHDEGEWLQEQVNLAFARQDEEIAQLSRRAASPVIARIIEPVSATSQPLQLTFWTRPVLKVSPGVDYRAEVWASVDGGELTRLGMIESDRESGLDRLPPEVTAAGLHHLRIRVLLTFSEASGLAPEVRDLPELVYARYDAAANRVADGRFFISSAMAVRADRLDAALPAIAFDTWLRDLVRSHGGKPEEMQWRTTHCEARIAEAGVEPLGREICAVTDFLAKGAIARIWIRTGRVELTETEARWLGERPTFAGLLLGGVEIGSLARLGDLLSTPRESWPSGDVAVAPEEITVTSAREAVQVNAVVRNAGSEPLHGVFVAAQLSNGTERGIIRGVVIDLPAFGTKTVSVDFPLLIPYGAVVIHALQLGEHAPFESWTPDPTPEDSFAFRLVNPRQAPSGYADWIKSQCGPPCRGF